jgi:hypothetical protein
MRRSHVLFLPLELVFYAEMTNVEVWGYFKIIEFFGLIFYHIFQFKSAPFISNIILTFVTKNKLAQ